VEESPWNKDYLETISPDGSIASISELPALIRTWQDNRVV